MASLRLEPKHLGVQSSERFPGRHLLDRMQAADPGNIKMPYQLAGLAIELDHPTGRARGLVEFLQTCQQHVSYEFERIDPPKMGKWNAASYGSTIIWPFMPLCPRPHV